MDRTEFDLTEQVKKGERLDYNKQDWSLYTRKLLHRDVKDVESIVMAGDGTMGEGSRGMATG